MDFSTTCPTPKRPLALPRYGHHYSLKIGLLGGSFNPAHAGHLHVAQQAIKHLRLDQLWLMVSPGNPLKPAKGMAPLAERLCFAQKIADGRKIIATDIETQLGTRYSYDTLRALKRRFPKVRFVWLMGADNLIQLPRWRRWQDILQTMPMLVVPRPGSTRRALAGKVAKSYQKGRLPARAGLCLPQTTAPAWILLPVQEHPASATALRNRLSEGI